jgi:hypothetical protein
MTNVEEILYDPRINTNAGNEIVREMFRDLDVEMILRNVVRGNGERWREREGNNKRNEKREKRKIERRGE